MLIASPVPWEEKEKVLFWRGGATNDERDVIVERSDVEGDELDVRFVRPSCNNMGTVSIRRDLGQSCPNIERSDS